MHDRPIVMVVEDEFLIALDLSETVQDLGYYLEGPFADNEHAFASFEHGYPDLAILDIYTADGEVFPLADALTEAGVQIIFHSGHMAPRDVQARYPGSVACAKPCSPGKMIDMMQQAIGRSHTVS
jgi:DNA-binding NtrC family response regulator